MTEHSQFQGMIGLLGSGETAAAGGTLFEYLAARSTAPFSVSVLETPAGFELNADKVARRVSDFLVKRLQNYQVQVTQVSARSRAGVSGTDDECHLEALANSQMVYMGAGSPTYTIRQLEGSLMWSAMTALHRRGTELAFASAAVIAVSAYALPVYEIYKVGEEPYWKRGLDVFGAFGLKLAIIPHWNNTDGGDELDTSHCFMGMPRYTLLTAQLPDDVKVLGIDEHTGLVMDFQNASCQVLGQGSVHIEQAGVEVGCYSKNDQFPISELGDYYLPDEEPVAHVLGLLQKYRRSATEGAIEQLVVPEYVQDLVDAREAARRSRDWTRSDDLREQIEAAGWQVSDTPAGPVVGKK